MNGPSENESIFCLEEHLQGLADSLSMILRDRKYAGREIIYHQIHKFICNLGRFELDCELLMKKQICRHLSTVYALLKEINDSSEAYASLLWSTESLIAKLKQQILDIVDYS